MAAPISVEFFLTGFPTMPRLLPSLALTCTLFTALAVNAAQQTAPITLTVLGSGGIMGAIRAIAPGYEKTTGVTLNIQAAPSMGNTAQAIPNRLARKEPADVVLMVGSALDTLVAQGQVNKASRVDLGKSFIAMAVREGERHPDISTLAAFRQTLLDSTSLAYSDSASGVYLSRILFPSMALGADFPNKARMIAAEPVGEVVARGDVNIGFQQLSELKPVKGIDIVGLIPDSVQKMTLYSGAVTTTSAHAQAARALLTYLSSKEAAKVIEHSGLKPVTAY